MMVDWVEWQAVATGVLVVTSAAGIIYAGLQLRHEREYRAVTNLEKQLEFFHSAKFVEARRLLARERLDSTGNVLPLEQDDPPVSVFAVLDFYEHLGLLVKKGHLELYDVWHTFYEWVQPVYADMCGSLEDRTLEWTGHYSDLRRLVKGMDAIQRSRMRRKSQHGRLWSPERIAEHYQYELESQGENVPRRLRSGRRGTTISATQPPVNSPMNISTHTISSTTSAPEESTSKQT